MILPSDPLVVPQPGFRSVLVLDSSTWVSDCPIRSRYRLDRLKFNIHDTLRKKIKSKMSLCHKMYLFECLTDV
jgi:hypothetical protein